MRLYAFHAAHPQRGPSLKKEEGLFTVPRSHDKYSHACKDLGMTSNQRKETLARVKRIADDVRHLIAYDGVASPSDENDMLHGLNWREKIVYAVRGREKVASIIHEMGHVFADRYPPDSSRCREWRWFGWEMVIARRIGAWGTWSRHNARYGVGDAEWGELPTKRRQAVIADRVRYAKRVGILSETGEPRSVR